MNIREVVGTALAGLVIGVILLGVSVGVAYLEHVVLP
jgi:hypothetical protein